MIRTILWDFDGVILDSMKIKGNGFVKLFEQYDAESLKKIEEYHYENGGVSRFEKIRYFYEKIVFEEVSDKKIKLLAEEFSKIIASGLEDKSNLIQESMIFIKLNYRKYNFHIVSGAEEKELRKLCSFFGIEKYFLSINGSPVKKEFLVDKILKEYRYFRDETILIGDSINDYHASLKNGINFYGYNNVHLQKHGTYIASFNGLNL